MTYLHKHDVGRTERFAEMLKDLILFYFFFGLKFENFNGHGEDINKNR